MNTRATLTGSSLEAIPAFTVVLSNFEGNFLNWISITEIKLTGERFGGGEVPEPSTALPLGIPAAALLLRRMLRPA